VLRKQTNAEAKRTEERKQDFMDEPSMRRRYSGRLMASNEDLIEAAKRLEREPAKACGSDRACRRMGHRNSWR
jgi:hypothetical protein